MLPATGNRNQSDRSTADSILKMLRYLGILGFLGGLASLSAMWGFGPTPVNEGEWRVLIGVMRPIFYSCFFTGIVILAIAGSISWWRHRRTFNAARWFRVMMLALLVTVPSLHLSARFTALKLYASLDEGNLDRVQHLWNRLGWFFAIGFVVMITITAIGVFKPRFGQSSETTDEHG